MPDPLTLALAAGAGVLSFFSPCCVPLLPAYFGHLSGVTLMDLEKGGTRAQMKVFFHALLFVVGFSGIFIILGSLKAQAENTVLPCPNATGIFALAMPNDSTMTRKNVRESRSTLHNRKASSTRLIPRATTPFPLIVEIIFLILLNRIMSSLWT